MASSLGDEANEKQDNSLRDKSIAWEDSMFACFTIGGAAMITGIVLWAISPDEYLAGYLTGVSIVPGPDGMKGTCSYYWSSSKREDYSYVAWYVRFSCGAVSDVSKASTIAVRCVR